MTFMSYLNKSLQSRCQWIFKASKQKYTEKYRNITVVTCKLIFTTYRHFEQLRLPVTGRGKQMMMPSAADSDGTWQMAAVVIPVEKKE